MWEVGWLVGVRGEEVGEVGEEVGSRRLYWTGDFGAVLPTLPVFFLYFGSLSWPVGHA